MTKRREVRDVDVTVMMLSVKRPRGHRLLLEFLRDFQAGVIPASENTAQLAEAFERIVFDGQHADDALDLKVGKGRPQMNGAEHARRAAQHGKVLEFIFKRLDVDHKRGNISRAVRSAAAKFHKDEKTVWTIWKHKDLPLSIRRFRVSLEKQRTEMRENLERLQGPFRIAYEVLSRQQPVIHAYAATLTPRQRARFMAMDGQECYRIALAHQKSLARK